MLPSEKPKTTPNPLTALVENAKAQQEEKDKPKGVTIPVEKKQGFLENPKALRNARSGALAFIIILIPLFYFLISDSFSFAGLLTWGFGGIMIVTTIATVLVVMETRKRAFEDAIIANPDIATDEIIVTENGLKISENTLAAIPVLNKYNNKMQEVYNWEKTQKKIDKLHRKNASLQIVVNYATFHIRKLIVFNWLFRRTARLNKIKKTIDRLGKFNLRDKRFKPYRLERLLSCQSSKNYTRIGDREIASNPQAVNVKKSIIKIPMKGFMMSLSGGVIPLAFGADFFTILAFYGGYLAGMSFTVLSQYILTKYKTNTEYRNSLDKKKTLQTMILTELAKVVVETKVPAEATVTKIQVKPVPATAVTQTDLVVLKGQLSLDLFKGVGVNA